MSTLLRMKPLTLLLFLVLLCGCTRTLTRAGLEAKVTSTDTPIYYTGSDDLFDYFAIRDGRQNEIRLYSVPQQENAVASRFLATPDRAKWQLYEDPAIAVTNR